MPRSISLSSRHGEGLAEGVVKKEYLASEGLNKLLCSVVLLKAGVRHVGSMEG